MTHLNSAEKIFDAFTKLSLCINAEDNI